MAVMKAMINNKNVHALFFNLRNKSYEDLKYYTTDF